jgi:hypothetical protein
MIDQNVITSIQRVLVEGSHAAFRDPISFVCFVVVLYTTWVHFLHQINLVVGTPLYKYTFCTFCLYVFCRGIPKQKSIASNTF